MADNPRLKAEPPCSAVDQKLSFDGPSCQGSALNCGVCVSALHYGYLHRVRQDGRSAHVVHAVRKLAPRGPVRGRFPWSLGRVVARLSRSCASCLLVSAAVNTRDPTHDRSHRWRRKWSPRGFPRSVAQTWVRDAGLSSTRVPCPTVSVPTCSTIRANVIQY